MKALSDIFACVEITMLYAAIAPPKKTSEAGTVPMLFAKMTATIRRMMTMMASSQMNLPRMPKKAEGLSRDLYTLRVMPGTI